ncbi:MAG: hypothetical protein KJ725_01080 [Gammaproteobacteria bacterium]|jgi:hypothetical protein|uniref:hypothetical protein n=1 Tax=Methylotuvimicrobium sp. TaxID=2822413 RepID=UPI001DF3A6FF|nr:hypothetical protein [Gammaproteobacteria bacterium]
MKLIKPLIACCLLLQFSSVHAQGNSSMHDGHGAGGGGGSACQKLRINKNKLVPAHLAEVAPESDITFNAFGFDKPENLEVTVKKIPIAITTEFKDPFYVVRGKLPPELKGTHARINVKLRSPIIKCISEDGWLVKILE